jgi:hypothetical protein
MGKIACDIRKKAALSSSATLSSAGGRSRTLWLLAPTEEPQPLVSVSRSAVDFKELQKVRVAPAAHTKV